MRKKEREAISECIENIYKCLNKIEDETEICPGSRTIRGTDGGVIDVTEITSTIDVARSDPRHIEQVLTS